MDTSKLHEKLIAAGKASTPVATVPYFFEQRVMRQLQGAKVSPWTMWEQSLIRAAFCSVVFMLTLTVGSHFLDVKVAQTQSLSQDVEQTLFAAVDSSNGDLGIE